MSARSGLDDRIEGYRSGANIYLNKSLSLDELRAVVGGFSQRRETSDTSGCFSATLNPRRMTVTGPAGEVRLTQPEVLLLAAFSRAQQNDLEHWQVAAQLGQDEEISKDNLEVRIGRLRRKLIASGLEPPVIRSVRGVGYRLCCTIMVSAE